LKHNFRDLSVYLSEVN